MGWTHRAHPIREVLLVLLPLLISLGACAGRLPELEVGPMVGAVTSNAARIWVAAPGVEVRVEYGPAAEPGLRQRTEVRSISSTGVIEIEGLERDTRYEGLVMVAGHEPVPIHFRSAPAASDEVELCVALGSCAYFNDPETDQGKPYGGDPRIFRAMAEARPDLMFWLGDNIYYRDSDLADHALMRRRQMRPRRNADCRALFAACANVGIWDDHDFGPNDSDGSYADKDFALALFREMWPNPQAGLPATPGVFFRHRLGDVEFFATDGRYHRSPDAAPDGPEKTMLGTAQFDWLVAALESSDAAFKIVVFGNQVLNPLCRFEGMGLYQHERDRLLAAIGDREIAGLIFVSGDRHHSEIIRIDRPGSYPLFDVTISPLLSGTHGSEEKDNPARVPGTYLTDVRNYALFRFAGRGPERRLRIEFRDPDGTMLAEAAFRAADLR